MGPQGLGLEITELRLGLPGGGGGGVKNEKKRVFAGVGAGVNGGGKNRNMDLVVGWPPVCLYRKKNVCDITKLYVKVSMDGAPILRKVDLSCFKGYSDLGMALEKLFDCFGIEILETRTCRAILFLNRGSSSILSSCEAMKGESEGCEYVAIYEDKDGDWMLVGDVPWPMFTETCNRLRIKKKSDAN